MILKHLWEWTILCFMSIRFGSLHKDLVGILYQIIKTSIIIIILNVILWHSRCQFLPLSKFVLWINENKWSMIFLTRNKEKQTDMMHISCKQNTLRVYWLMHTGKVTVKIYSRQNLNVWKCKHDRNAVQTHLQQLTEQDQILWYLLNVINLKCVIMGLLHAHIYLQFLVPTNFSHTISKSGCGLCEFIVHTQNWHIQHQQGPLNKCLQINYLN